MKIKNILGNYAFIDGQNLHLGTTSEGWKVDFYKFRKYLKDKFNVSKAFFFMGYMIEEDDKLYSRIQDAGFIIVFKKSSEYSISQKKGNVDSDIIFGILTSIIDKECFEKIVLVSGDGDYIKLVDYLIRKELFKKILFPNKKCSLLYRKINSKFKMNLWQIAIRKKIEHKKK